MKKEILKQLRTDYEDREIRPSSDLWDKIEGELEKASDLSVKQPFQWWKYAAAVLLLFFMGALVYFNTNKTGIENTITQNKLPEKAETHSEAVQQNDINQETMPSSSFAVENNVSKENIVDKEENINTQVRPQKNNLSAQKTTKIQSADIFKNLPEIASADQIKAPDIIKPDDEKVIINQLPVSPEISEKKPSKYIQASDLLAGREYDKAEGNKHKGSYIRIDLDKLKPHFSQVVTLGVTVRSSTGE
ncbi:hypothetical protein [Chryseobacterium tongliaoense]|uniref:hypothetical protein n=1 Tax=Chryseobacterium tongliaoense TaxID=3240933 RepID=UPI0035197F01